MMESISIPIPAYIGLFLSGITLWSMHGEGAINEDESNSISGTVTEVHDGDTLTILYSGKKYESKNGKLRIRLHASDSPEFDERRNNFQQPFGYQAKKSLTKMCMDKEIKIIVYNKSYDRIVGDVWCDGVLVNVEMIRLGLAWVDERYVNKKESSLLIMLQNEAKAARRGLWSQNKPEEPWVFRERIRSENKKG